VLGTGVVGSFVGRGVGIIEGDNDGSAVVGNNVGLGEGISEGAPVGKCVGLLVGSHVVQLKVTDIAAREVVNPLLYVAHISVDNGGVLIQLGLIDS